jgi:hypothetical protein
MRDILDGRSQNKPFTFPDDPESLVTTRKETAATYIVDDVPAIEHVRIQSIPTPTSTGDSFNLGNMNFNPYTGRIEVDGPLAVAAAIASLLGSFADGNERQLRRAAERQAEEAEKRAEESKNEAEHAAKQAQESQREAEEAAQRAAEASEAEENERRAREEADRRAADAAKAKEEADQKLKLEQQLRKL